LAADRRELLGGPFLNMTVLKVDKLELFGLSLLDQAVHEDYHSDYSFDVLPIVFIVNEKGRYQFWP